MVTTRVRSIRKKLLLMVLAANFCTLLLAGAALMYNDLRNYRDALVDELNTQAAIVGQASAAALVFNDAKVVNENLALLQAKPEIAAAAIYTASGALFGRYQRDSGAQERFPASPGRDGVVFSGEELTLLHGVNNQQERVGTVYLKAQYGFRQRLLDYLGILSTVMVASLLAGLAISSRLQRWVTQPIQSVSDVARQVMEQRCFHLRATKTTDDEVGYLVDAFNDMLAEIGRRTAEIEASRQALEHEISERRVVQKSLQTSERRNRTLVEAMATVVWSSDVNGCFNEAQDSWGRFTGQTPAEYLGTGWRSAFHVDDRTALDLAWSAATALPASFAEELSLWHAESGRYREVSLRAVPLLNDDGTVAEWIGTITDVDDRRAAEREVLKLNAELEQRVADRTTELEIANQALVTRTQDAEAANRAKAEFLANMSHEIRTPMNAVLGLAYLLEQGSLDDDALDLVKKIRSAGRSLQSIINDILDFSKIEAGRLEIEHAPFRLGDVLDNIATIMGSNAGDKDLELVVGTPPQVAEYLVGDALRLEQVLINLTGNAIKFTEHGSVAVCVDLVRQDETTVTLRLAVRDTGIGIPREQQSQIFSAFAQADASTTRRFGGTGLGLTICRLLVTKMGGEIGVSSIPGVGSEFWFTIPFQLAPIPAYATPDLVKLDILVADDSPLACDNLLAAAGALGWSATAVDSGEAAVEQVMSRLGRPHVFDVVVLDWKMPGLNGLSAAKAIRRAMKDRTMPIVIMATAFSRDDLLKQPNVDLIDGILSKPVTTSCLYNAVAGAQQRHGGDPARPLLIRAASQRIAGVRVLVVDDSEINREVAQRILAADGGKVTLASDGEAAISWLRANPGGVDIVLMDVQMPVMDGYEATRRLRLEPQLAGLPIVALTAGAFKAQQDAARAAGMNDFVAKPFDVDTLIDVIQRLTTNNSASPAAESGAPSVYVSRVLAPPVEPMPAPVTRLAASPAVPGELPGIEVSKGMHVWANLGVYCKFLTKFVNDNADAIRTMRDGLARGDMQMIGALAHKLKGAAGNLALTETAALLHELEVMLANNGDLSSVLERLEMALATATASVATLAAAITPAAGKAPASALADPAALAPLLADLLRALDSDNPKRAAPLLAALDRALPEDRLIRLRASIDNFDFRAAEDCTRHLAADLGIALKE